MKQVNVAHRRQLITSALASAGISKLLGQSSAIASTGIDWSLFPNWLGAKSQSIRLRNNQEKLALDSVLATVAQLRAWVNLNLNLIIKYQQNPLRAARALAYTQVALCDAFQRALIDPALLAFSVNERLASMEIAASRAAYGVLEQLYPHETPGIFASRFVLQQIQMIQRLSQQRLLMPSNELIGKMTELGRNVAELAIVRSLRDGAGRVWALNQRPREFPGMWQATYPLYAVNPLEALAGDWQPWVTSSTPLYEPPNAANLGSEQHTKETREVLQVSQKLTASQREIAHYWHLEAGSVTPGGIWTKLAWDAGLDRLASMSNSTGSIDAISELLSAMSATGVAICDSFIAAWRVKYRDWSERPITAIRRELQADFVPLLVTPGFPAYVSGHATISGAAAHVLGTWLPQRAQHFEALAREAALSRLYGGIHFRSDNEQGLLLGQSVAIKLLFKFSAS